ncbi:aspartate aminotransferase A [Legionella birminghamensis]|uniref:Aminotransferase n=1 Tax=Legionella birminghamensis TaxID=28083 RepID=A0A378I5N7_9GAMM|nr:pyridoxal phosphate-dependent aminotransferase [Legionella birminghamensis]KTC72385.1 aspartate aminotransferase A [Legionella birminghamensis]STX30517.1 kynurenine--oxoglutarate transaminase [Legionella birminghamensis]
MILTPYGQPAEQIEKVMLLSMWAKHLGKSLENDDISRKMLFAGLGKPTYPINRHTIQAYKRYWNELETIANRWHDSSDLDNNECAIDYVDPYGDYQARILMAKAMSDWYDAEVTEKNILFTVGGIGGLRIIFEVLNSLYAKHSSYRVITPFPHYSAYTNNPHHTLHPVDVMREPGYQLTAKALEKSIQQALHLAENDGIYPKAVLICNPSNPLGTIINEEEFQKIADVLRQYPDLHIILDEAYAEMCFKELPSVIKIAPDLKTRTIILRSATKALSAAGERMAVILAFDEFIVSELVRQQITSYVHPPRSGQIAYAETMLNFSEEDRQAMSSYYKEKVEYVSGRLKKMGAAMECSEYQVEATFYVLGDFSDLMGMPIPMALEKVMNKRGLVQTGEELAYYLLFKASVMVAPLSYFGMAKDCGAIRITCSAKPNELEEMMNRLERQLFQARSIKNSFLVSEIQSEIEILEANDPLKKEISRALNEVQKVLPTCAGLKQQNSQLTHLLNRLENGIKQRNDLIDKENRYYIN